MGADLAACRESPAVLVSGPVSLTDPIAHALTHAGATRILRGEWADDQLDLALRSGRAGRPGRLTPSPAVVVLAGYRRVDPVALAIWAGHGVAHLPLVAEPRVVTVGPLVTLPLPSDAPCAGCLQLARAPARVGLDAGPDPGPVLGFAAAAAAMVATAYLQGVALPAGVTLECTSPWPRVDHRRWPRHPRCDGSAHRDPIGRETMAG